jgi:DNA-binding IclR family transcriptional regulator
MANTLLDLPKVTVHGLGGAMTEARLVEERDGFCYVLSEREYRERAQRGETIEARLGFPKGDVTPISP